MTSIYNNSISRLDRKNFSRKTSNALSAAILSVSIYPSANFASGIDEKGPSKKSIVQGYLLQKNKGPIADIGTFDKVSEEIPSSKEEKSLLIGDIQTASDTMAIKSSHDEKISMEDAKPKIKTSKSALITIAPTVLTAQYTRPRVNFFRSPNNLDNKTELKRSIDRRVPHVIFEKRAPKSKVTFAPYPSRKVSPRVFD